jgi:hypothetical protein
MVTEESVRADAKDKADAWGDKNLSQAIERKAYAAGYGDAVLALYPGHEARIKELQEKIDSLTATPKLDLEPHE